MTYAIETTVYTGTRKGRRHVYGPFDTEEQVYEFLGVVGHLYAPDDCAWPEKHPKPCDCRARAARNA
jgi:hypothetical protein